MGSNWEKSKKFCILIGHKKLFQILGALISNNILPNSLFIFSLEPTGTLWQALTIPVPKASNLEIL